MRYAGMTLNFRENQYKQVNKKQAERAFCEGEEILMLSSNMRFDNMWVSPCSMTLKEVQSRCATDDPKEIFDHMCSDYEYYNCDRERGKYIQFFIQI